MKLEEIRGEKAFDAISGMVTAIANIAGDEDFVKAVKEMQGKKDKGAVIKTIVPVLLDNHRDDVVAILSIMNGQSREEYLAELTPQKLIADIWSVLTDEDIVGFLSPVKTAKDSGSTSGNIVAMQTLA